MVTSGSCPVHFGCPSPAARSFLSSYTWLSGCHCSEYLPSRRPLLCSPFIPSGFAGPRPTLGSVGHSVFSLCPTRPPLFPGKGACQELGLRTPAALVQAWPRESLTLLRKGQGRDGLFLPRPDWHALWGSSSHAEGLCDSSLLQPSCAHLTRSHWTCPPPPPPTPQVYLHENPSCPFPPVQNSMPPLLNQLMVSGDLDGQLRALPCPPLPCGEVDRRQPSMGTEAGSH